MKQYDIHIKVGENSLTTVIDVLKDCADIINMKQCEEEIPAKKGPRFVGGKRDKGISGYDLIIELLKDGQVHTLDELSQSFVKRGFAPSSASPALTKAVQSSLVYRVGPFHFCKAGSLVGVNMASEPFTVVGQLKKEK